MNNIRNFAIIAHVDHGKSTLADRFLEITGVVVPGKHPEQFLDRNPISRERGITIKLAPVRMEYKYNSYNDYKSYILDLIDTPGHIDFSYEVERTLACVEGVILLVDATQGVQAQTIAHLNKALEQNLAVIPVVNKIDLATAQISQTKKQMAEFLRIDESEIYEVSAKTGQNVEKLLQAVIQKIPVPKNTENTSEVLPNESVYGQGSALSLQFTSEVKARKSPLQCLIFDSYYDQYRGVIAFVRVFNGKIQPGMKANLYANKIEFEVLEVGIFTPDLKQKNCLSSGEIGYVVTDLKDIHQVSVGDTIIDKIGTSPLPGYKKAKPMVYASIFPVDVNEFTNLKRALDKLILNDASLTYEAIHSSALGAGFRLGFLGLLHAEVVRERLEREFNLNLLLTPPQVKYKGLNLNNPKGLKLNFLEPYIKIMIVTPSKFLAAVMRLCQEHRARFIDMDNQSSEQACLFTTFISYEMPMAEMISNFYDQLKSVSSGYASLDWEFLNFEPVEADKLEILLNNTIIEEFSEIVVKEKSYQRTNFLVKRIRQVIPRQQFEVKIQAKYQGKIIASERITPFRKDVTQKLYGGDRTRKEKLLEKQKRGKKMMKNIGQVKIPKEAFLKLFRN